MISEVTFNFYLQHLFETFDFERFLSNWPLNAWSPCQPHRIPEKLLFLVGISSYYYGIRGGSERNLVKMPSLSLYCVRIKNLIRLSFSTFQKAECRSMALNRYVFVLIAFLVAIQYHLQHTLKGLLALLSRFSLKLYLMTGIDNGNKFWGEMNHRHSIVTPSSLYQGLKISGSSMDIFILLPWSIILNRDWPWNMLYWRANKLIRNTCIS